MKTVQYGEKYSTHLALASCVKAYIIKAPLEGTPVSIYWTVCSFCRVHNTSDRNSHIQARTQTLHRKQPSCMCWWAKPWAIYLHISDFGDFHKTRVLCEIFMNSNERWMMFLYIICFFKNNFGRSGAVFEFIVSSLNKCFFLNPQFHF